MKTITMATEKRVATADCKYADLLKYLLQEMKCRVGCYGASVKEMKNWNIELENETQINVVDSYELYGLCYLYNDYIRYIGTHDLSYVNIDDFNGLVKAVIAGSEVRNGCKG